MIGSSRLHLHGRALWTARRSFVDYRAEYGAGISVRHPIHSRMAVVGAGEVTIVPVEADLSDVGRRWALASKVVSASRGLEPRSSSSSRSNDGSMADPIEARPRNWGLVGVRLLGP